ncbi:colicin immunity protein [Ochrobactrum sp. MYb379]|uniref:colicin immunity protein n=1 Tax=Ochrobactrum sp. MYb379 TaxID=2745275 RepID=UPI003098520E
MRLSRTAAMSVCRLATDRSFHVLRVEGGIWHSPGFEARVDSIWDSKYGNLNNDIIMTNNESAVEFIKNESFDINSFIITVSGVVL